MCQKSPPEDHFSGLAGKGEKWGNGEKQTQSP